MTQPQVQWTSPAPLWTKLIESETNDRSQFRRPAILRFATDDFMEEYLRLLTVAPERLDEWIAVGETWRKPAPIPQAQAVPVALTHLVHNQTLNLPSTSNGSAAQNPPEPQEKAVQAAIDEEELKLYQPAHQRFYLISACLVCRKPGLPDRALDTNRGEKATFVIRRLRPASNGGGAEPPTPGPLSGFTEYGFIPGAEGDTWQPLGLSTDPASSTLLPGEEQMPLFGVTYRANDNRNRRLLSGLIPVGKRETLLGAVLSDAQAQGGSETEDDNSEVVLDSRLALFISQATQPWRALIDGEQQTIERLLEEEPVKDITVWEELEGDFIEAIETAFTGYEDLSESDAGKVAADYWTIKLQTDEQARMGSWYTLLDFADALQTHLNSLWKILPDGDDSDLSPEEQNLVTILGAKFASGTSLAEALTDIVGYSTALDGANLVYSDTVAGPILDFPLDPDNKLTGYLLTDNNIATLATVADGERFSPLEKALAKALESTKDQPVIAPPSLAVQLSSNDLDFADPGWFIIRCVYERTHCMVNPPLVVSEASDPFQLAIFFDPDGPARPIRITLPVDTTPAGLRKFAKNTAFVMSDILACQVGQVRDITLADLVLSVLPWPFHKSLPEPEEKDCQSSDTSSGMVCSLSIPIVTLCALILLIIIVNLFDFIFRWIQFFFICFPIPGLKAKDSS